MEPIETQAPTSQPDDESTTTNPEPVPEPEIILEYSPEQLLGPEPEAREASDPGDVQTKAMLEALVYVTEEPLTLDQIATALNEPKERVRRLLDELTEEYARPEHGVTVREVAGGFKMGTKPEHHEAIRQFVKNLKPPLKLSLAALETLAVIAYKQPITSPEIMEIRGVQGTSVLKTLLDRKLIATAGRKNVIGKPMLYKTTRDFLVQFGLKDLSELPTLKEFEELRRLSIIDEPVLGLDSPPPTEPEFEPSQPAAAVEPEPEEPPAQEPSGE
ncbi:MAG: SMC-Scp complex subunit ScpB [Acidobacteria bacterium]|nr:SMC-Scp complex subunit ScpB [Acidobacteriota bacterium]